MITQEGILEDLKHIKQTTGHIPTKARYRKDGKYDPATVVRKFQSWNNALRSAFDKVNFHRSTAQE